MPRQPSAAGEIRMITEFTLARLRESLPDDEFRDVENVLMRSAFDAVAPRHDWRAAVDAEIDADAVGFGPNVIKRAVLYMTATQATVEETARGMIRVRAIGYRAGPAG